MIKEFGFLISLTSHIMSAKYKRLFFQGFPGGSDGKEYAGNAGDPDLIPGLGRSPGEGNDKPLQYSCLENPMDRGTWWATVHGVTKSQTQLSNWHLNFSMFNLKGLREEQVYETSFSSNT